MKKWFLIVMALIMSMVLVTGCSGGGSSKSSDDAGETVVSEDAGEDGSETVAQSFDEDAIREQLEVKELGMYVQPYSNVTSYGYAAIVKNNSDQDIELSCSIVFYDSEGAPVGTEDSMINYVKAGGTTLMFADGDMDKPKKAEIEWYINEPTTEIISDKMETKSTLRSDQIIVEMTNTSDKDAEFACAACAFYHGDKLVDCEYCYCVNDDNILEAGKKRVGDVSWIGNEKVDTVKVYPDARAVDAE